MSHTPETLPPRRPWLAALANLMVSGLGLLYAGALGHALIWACAPVVASVLVAAVVRWLPLPSINVALITAIALTVPVGGMWIGWRTASRADHPFTARPCNKGWTYVAFALVVGIGNILFLDGIYRTDVLEAFRFRGSSMGEALKDGDYFFVMKKRMTTPEPGRLVTFEAIDDPRALRVKRLVAIGGDTVAIVAGRVVRNSETLPDRHIRLTESTSVTDTVSLRMFRDLHKRFAPDDSATGTLDNWGPLVVPPAEIFVLGDDLGESYDSRYYGPVPAENIRGRPQMIYFSRDSTGIRWGRLGQSIR